METKALKLRDNFYWAGILDDTLRVFDIIMTTHSQMPPRQHWASRDLTKDAEEFTGISLVFLPPWPLFQPVWPFPLPKECGEKRGRGH